MIPGRLMTLSSVILRRSIAANVMRVNASRSSHDHGHGHGHVDEWRIKQLMPIDKKNVTDPELLKHLEGYEKCLRENYAHPPESPDPWTLDPVKIANDPLHDLHDVHPNFWPGRMDELPLPQEPWAQAYARQQKYFNIALATMTTLFVTVNLIFWNHPVMQFHFTPPTDITDLNWNPDNDDNIRV
ncbi:uncharacterized protein LOC141857920 [Brevipalpus obovatus]|uniref:uncharacterized protein LOC141857920 n=1 Tax=Brevipalpus obovatus TaxID=246614 RepID=UPI003D9F10BC